MTHFFSHLYCIILAILRLSISQLYCLCRCLVILWSLVCLFGVARFASHPETLCRRSKVVKCCSWSQNWGWTSVISPHRGGSHVPAPDRPVWPSICEPTPITVYHRSPFLRSTFPGKSWKNCNTTKHFAKANVACLPSQIWMYVL